MSPRQAFSLDGVDFTAGRNGFPGRSFPEALRGEGPFALPAMDSPFERTLFLVAVFLFEPPFLKGVLKRLSLVVDGLSPLVFCAVDTEQASTVKSKTSPSRFKDPDSIAVFLADAFKKYSQKR